MERFEINVWKDSELLSKEIVEFNSIEECYKYVTNKYHGPNSWTGNHQNKSGVKLWRPPVGIRVTWSKLGAYKYKPPKMSAEDKKLQRDLYDSITTKTMQELGPNEMYAKVREDYLGHPDERGYEEKK
jgi:hypothetical protein|tara:strand:+ start:120 stop:503 length:384 start_codon:yes stop_codon:yes gene_type:complete